MREWRTRREVRVNRLVLEFRKAKETKGTFRYEEVEAAGGEVAVGSLYIKKAALGDQPPERLRVTIEGDAGGSD
jgi:hypothetical protein